MDPHGSHQARETLGAVYRLLARLPADERIAFALRRIDEMELTEVARACHLSLSSIKRRLARAEAHFAALARDVPALADYLQGGSPWVQE